MTNLFTYLSNGKLKYICALVVLLCLSAGNAWGAKHSMTPNQATTGSSSTVYITSLTSFRSESPTGSKIKWQMNQWNPKTLQVKTNVSTAANEFRFYTDSVLPGKITKVVVSFSALTVTDASKLMFKGGTSAQTGTTSGTAGTWNGTAKTLTWTPGSSDNYTYFAFYQNGKAASGTNNLASSNAIVVTYLTKVTLDKNTGSADGVAYFDDNAAGASTATGYTFSAATHASKTCTGYYTAPSDGTKVLNADGSFAAANVSGYITSSKWTYAGGTLKLYAQWETAASCSANPTIGNASLNGSISLSSIPLSISSVGGGTDCTLAEYGFVWKAGSSPSASDNKTKIGESSSATSFTGNITGSFSTGVTYYIKGYAINNGPNTTLSSTALTITPRSITFNSNGGSSVSTIYVNSGTAASAPTAPTKTGYNFGGWYTDNGTFASAVNWSSTISENKTYYAKWTAKTTTISFNQNSGSGGQTGTLTATYDAAMPSAPVTCPTRTGYDFGGYYDGSGGTGTQYYTSTGASARNWDKENSTWTLYAKWTIKNYTVTWKVNGEEYTAGTPTDNVNHGSHVTTLPTAPSTASYCGDKFMGWTDATDGAYVHGTSNLYTKASEFPNATGNQVFYAVFADYVAP